MYTDKDLLKFAGRLANACEVVLKSNILNLSGRLEVMKECLDEYNNAIYQATEERK
jgi:hypothetical protein